MAPVPGSSTFADGLSALLTSLAPLKVLPDADPEVIANLEALIVSAVQNAQASEMQGQLGSLTGGGPGGGAMSMSGPMGGGGPLPMPAPMPGGPAGPGPMPGAMGMGAPGPGRGYSPQPAPPNTDELRRILDVG